MKWTGNLYQDGRIGEEKGECLTSDEDIVAKSERFINVGIRIIYQVLTMSLELC